VSGRQAQPDHRFTQQAYRLHGGCFVEGYAISHWVPQGYGIRYVPHQKQETDPAYGRFSWHSGELERRRKALGPEQEGQGALDVPQENQAYDQAGKQ
jgi:hypothetical protein